MLVLSRKVNERIVIRNDIEITVIAVRGGQVRLGIKAPMEVGVRRSELSARPYSPPISQPVDDVRPAASPHLAK